MSLGVRMDRCHSGIARVLVGFVVVGVLTALAITVVPARAQAATTFYTQYAYSYKILSKTKLSDQFSAYSRVGNVLYLQAGNQYPKITAKSKTVEYDMSVKLGTPSPTSPHRWA